MMDIRKTILLRGGPRNDEFIQVSIDVFRRNVVELAWFEPEPVKPLYQMDMSLPKLKTIRYRATGRTNHNLTPIFEYVEE